METAVLFVEVKCALHIARSCKIYAVRLLFASDGPLIIVGLIGAAQFMSDKLAFDGSRIDAARALDNLRLFA